MHAREQKILKWVLGSVVSGFICFILAYFLYFHLLSPEAREARRFSSSCRSSKSRRWIWSRSCITPPLFNGFLYVTNREQISRIANLVRSAQPYSPNHPQQRWILVLRFILKDRQFSGHVLSTSNQGVLFYYGLDVDGGPVYGTYRQDALGPLVEALARSETVQQSALHSRT
jgi:hypothetical protein